MQEKTTLGIWLSRLAVDRCITMADIAHELDVSPSLLSLVTRGKRAVPGNLYYKIVDKFQPKGNLAFELDEAFRKLHYEGGIMSHESVPYAVCKVVDKHKWTKEMMKLFASCVNNLTEDEISKYKEEFQRISKRTNKN